MTLVRLVAVQFPVSGESADPDGLTRKAAVQVALLIWPTDWMVKALGT